MSVSGKRKEKYMTNISLCLRIIRVLILPLKLVVSFIETLGIDHVLQGGRTLYYFIDPCTVDCRLW